MAAQTETLLSEDHAPVGLRLVTEQPSLDEQDREIRIQVRLSLGSLALTALSAGATHAATTGETPNYLAYLPGTVITLMGALAAFGFGQRAISLIKQHRANP